MLPPLRSQASSSQPTTGQRGDAVAASLVAVAPSELGAISSGLDLNSALIGQLNLLLLTTDERLAQHFSVLTDVFGRSLGLARGDDETTYDFARRIVQSLETLSPERLSLIEKQLNQLFDGLKLQTLMEAFADPRGSAAAAMAAHIETQSTGSDVAARTVLTLYRQYEVDDGARAFKAPVSGPLQVPAGQFNVSSNTPGRQETAAFASRAGATPPPSTGSADASAFRPLSASNANTVTAFVSTAGSAQNLPETRAATVLPGNAGSLGNAGSVGSPADATTTAKAQAPNLTQQLQRLQTSPSPTTASPSSPATAGGSAAQTGATTAGQSAAIASGLKPDTNVAAENPASSPAIEASLKQIESLYTALVWREPTATVGASLIRPQEGDGFSKLLANTLFGPTTPEVLADERQQASSGSSSSNAAVATAQQRSEQTTQPMQQTEIGKPAEIAASTNGGKAEAGAQPAASAPATDLSAALAAQNSARNAAAQPMVQYLFADDDPDEIVKEERHFFGHGSGEEADQGAGDEQAAQDGAEDGPAEEASAQLDQILDERAEMAPTDPDMERANDLYWRMGGWS